jgi:hypothetical protein
MGNQATKTDSVISTENSTDPFTYVAQDIKLKILSELTVRDLLSISSVSKTWYHISNEGIL